MAHLTAQQPPQRKNRVAARARQVDANPAKPRLPKYAQILEELRLEITSGKLTPGEYLPSQNELTSRYGVATGTVRQAIGKLTADGWVKPEKGRGVFVQPPHQRRQHYSVAAAARSLKSRQVGFVIFGDYSAYEPEAQMVLHGAMSVFEKAQRHVQYRIVRDDEHLEENLALFLEGVSAMIITRDVTPKAADMIAAAGVRTVVLDHRTKGVAAEHRFSRVVCSAERSGHLAAQTLTMHGHRHLGLITHIPEQHAYMAEILSGIRRACDEQDLPKPKVLFTGTRDQERAVIESLVTNKELSGIIAINDHPASRLVVELRQAGVNVPERKSVVSIGGLSRAELTEPSLARVNRNYLELGAAAAEVLLSDTSKIIHKTIESRFEAGQTLALAPSLSTES